MKTPIFSFITVNFNGINDTIELLASIYGANINIPFEIIVIDNGSKENEAELLIKEFPNITAIRSDKNLGFAGGNNLGIKIAKGKYLYLINNDTYIVSNRLDVIAKRFESDNSIGAITTKIYNTDKEKSIQFAGFTKLSPFTLRNKTIGQGERDEEKYNIACTTPYIHGASSIIKREIIPQIGYMPECYFLYYEELDWSERIKEKGFSIWYEPEFAIYHKESQSTGKESPLKCFYLSRNRLLFAKRNLKGTQFILSIIYQSFAVSLKNSLKHFIKGQFNLSTSTVKAVISFYRM